MTSKNIGVFVDATPEGEKRIDYAATLAPVRRPPCRDSRRVRGSPGVSIRLLCDREKADPQPCSPSGKRPTRPLTSNVRRRFEAISAKRDLSAGVPGDPSRWT